MSKKNLKLVETVGMVLVLVGAINWGLVGLGGFLNTNLNVVNMVLGSWPQVEWAVYVLVGLAGLWAFYGWSMKMSKK